jgi:hypothetical protein
MKVQNAEEDTSDGPITYGPRSSAKKKSEFFGTWPVPDGNFSCYLKKRVKITFICSLPELIYSSNT